MLSLSKYLNDLKKNRVARLFILTAVLALTAAFASCADAMTHASVQAASPQIVDTSHLPLGIDIPTPLNDRSEQLLIRKAYVASYNSDTRQPNWVAWKLTAEHTDGTVKRPGTAWHDDPEVPEPRARHSDYRGSGWDRGHMCPAGDNRWDSTAMYESFLLTNACPQDQSLNSGMWNQIEQSCRQWAKSYGTIYIVCGPIFTRQQHDTIGKCRIPVPEAFFKVVADLGSNPPKGIAFICRNNGGGDKKDQYTNTINEVERITGIHFFPNLDPKTASMVKDKADIGKW